MAAPLLKNRDIVFVGLQAWDVEIGSNAKNLAMEMARHNRVMFVTPPLDRITAYKSKNNPSIQRMSRVLQGKEPSLTKVGDSLWNLLPDCMLESINWISSPFIFDSLNKINNRRYANAIAKGIKELGFKDVILFNDNDIFRSFHLKELLKPAVSLYYSRDYLLAVNYWRRHGERLEPKLIAKSDAVVANSTYLAEYARQYNPHSYYVGQGCDLEMFDSAKITGPPPSDIAALTGNPAKPIIGYVGAILSLRLDRLVLEYIAANKPDWQLVLVGPEDPAFANSDLHKMTNVHFTGRKDGTELPAYINSFDVCINPQILNEVTIGNYPRKVDEYLAMGKPVVATKTKAMEVFAEHCYLATDKESYVTEISRALTENNSQKALARINFAGSHTWENNTAEIYKTIQKVETE
ncbi:MAG: glycosyltransferase [Bacteroidota bacterium]